MNELRKVFYNPPKGGNERGVETTQPMAPLPTPLREQVSAMKEAGGGGIGLEEARSQRASASGASGPSAQTSLRSSFEAGEMLARTNALQSGRQGQEEVRNYDRGRLPSADVDPTNGVNQFDREANREGDPHGQVDGPHSPPPAGIRRITLVQQPDTAMGGRSDAKPNTIMPRNRGNE